MMLRPQFVFLISYDKFYSAKKKKKKVMTNFIIFNTAVRVTLITLMLVVFLHTPCSTYFHTCS